MLRRLTDRSGGQEDKRRLILDAAVRVFAHKGYHTCRVSDIAEDAGVAHGLLYHYFRSKEELLETIFRETWRDVLDAVRSVEETDESARDRLAGIAKILLRAWRRDPDLVRVLVREVTRSSRLPQPLLGSRLRRVRPGLLDHDDRRLPAAAAASLHGVGCPDRARARRGRRLRPAAIARDRAVERHLPHADGPPPSVHARRARPDRLLPVADALS